MITFEYVITLVEKPDPNRLLAMGVCESIHHTTPGGLRLRYPVWPAVVGWAVVIILALGILCLDIPH